MKSLRLKVGQWWVTSCGDTCMVAYVSKEKALRRDPVMMVMWRMGSQYTWWVSKSGVDLSHGLNLVSRYVPPPRPAVPDLFPKIKRKRPDDTLKNLVEG